MSFLKTKKKFNTNDISSKNDSSDESLYSENYYEDENINVELNETFFDVEEENDSDVEVSDLPTNHETPDTQEEDDGNMDYISSYISTETTEKESDSHTTGNSVRDDDFSDDIVVTKKKNNKSGFSFKKKTVFDTGNDQPPNISKNKSASKKKSKNKTNEKKQAQEMAKLVPYDNVYSEMGMFSKNLDKEREIYSVAFRIGDVDPEQVVSSDPVEMNSALTNLLNGFGNDITYQFFTINRKTDEKDFLSKALIYERPGYEKYCKAYNDIITDNAWIGHNNMKKDKYVIFSIIAYTPDEALEQFKKIKDRTLDLFDKFYHMKIYDVSVEERLELIYSVYNMGGDAFGMRAGVNASEFKIDLLSKLKMTTKDVVRPKALEKNKDYVVLNNKLYARSFFISNFPSSVSKSSSESLSSNLISELTNISSQMVYSAYYEPLDAEYGFELAKKRVSDNTVVRNQHEKTTLADRKAGKVVKQHELKESTEKAYFDRASLDVLTEAKAEGTNIFLGTFIIVLYSDNLSDLERDTRLLILSASKFSFNVKTFDYVQMQGIASALPLANCYVNARRVFPVSRLCQLNPFDINASLREDGMFVGMHSINDNIILMNRKNLNKPTGLIAGIRSSGKTFQIKREIVNNLIGTNDLVFIISKNRERKHYEAFVKNLNGITIDNGKFDPFFMTEDYGVIEDEKTFKYEYLSALFSSILRFNDTMAASEVPDAEKTLAKEVEQIAENVDKWENLEDYIYNASGEFIYTRRALSLISTQYLDGKASSGKRLNYFVADSNESMLIILDRIWNLQIEAKKQNVSSWVYIDGIDGILRTPEGAKYLAHLFKLSNILQNPVTISIQESANFSEGNRKYMLEEILPQIGYFKLLNQGPIERRMYVEKLNIPQSLVQYITNSALGKGLVIDATSTVPFNDNAKEIYSNGDEIRRLYDPEYDL